LLAVLPDRLLTLAVLHLATSIGWPVFSDARSFEQLFNEFCPVLVAVPFRATDSYVLSEHGLLGLVVQTLAYFLLLLEGLLELLQQLALAILELRLALLNNDFASLHRIFFVRGVELKVRTALKKGFFRRTENPSMSRLGS
jgi:hypothetical protein